MANQGARTAVGASNGAAAVVRSRPKLVSVVVPVRNAEAFIAAQLEALSLQTYSGPWELVVVDNGCTDRSVDVVETWRGRLPEVTVVDARSRRGLNHARNRGAAAASGDLLAFCDADDVVSPGWLAALADAAVEADLVGGVQDGERLNDGPARAWRPSPYSASPHKIHGFLPHAPGGNCAIWKDVAQAVGWDESFKFGSSDLEFSWRAQLAGYRVGFASDALIYLRFRPSLRATVRQSFVYGKSDPQLYRRFRGEGMARASVGDALRAWRELLSSVSHLRSEPRRGRLLRQVARRCGRIVGSVRWRVLFL